MLNFYLLDYFLWFIEVVLESGIQKLVVGEWSFLYIRIGWGNSNEKAPLMHANPMIYFSK